MLLLVIFSKHKGHAQMKHEVFNKPLPISNSNTFPNEQISSLRGEARIIQLSMVITQSEKAR